MSFEDCFECGEPGHIAAHCPSRLAVEETRQPKPLWCGMCDKQTRLIEGMSHGRGVVMRCAACHPLRFVPLKQHKRCGGCNALIYQWDVSPCGGHQMPAL